ncbi:uncharacterized protein [Notamacropus eugenii]|uniref:uncharacterized protein n=1 Tax=Notamacropus eugenii TaxID=9315 RepID=UPI003B6729BF
METPQAASIPGRRKCMSSHLCAAPWILFQTDHSLFQFWGILRDGASMHIPTLGQRQTPLPPPPPRGPISRSLVNGGRGHYLPLVLPTIRPVEDGEGIILPLLYDHIHGGGTEASSPFLRLPCPLLPARPHAQQPPFRGRGADTRRIRESRPRGAGAGAGLPRARVEKRPPRACSRLSMRTSLYKRGGNRSKGALGSPERRRECCAQLVAEAKARKPQVLRGTFTVWASAGFGIKTPEESAQSGGDGPHL